MKKLLALVIVGIMLFSFVGCVERNNGSNYKKLEGVKEPVDILNALWDSYTEDDTFPIIGGDFNVENYVEGAPGKFDITDMNALNAQLVCPEKAVGMIDGAASMSHAMNANIFTGVVYHLKKASDMDKFTSIMIDSIKNNMWICGSPEKLLVAKLTDGYVIVCFGQDGDGKIFSTFKSKIEKNYSFADIKVDSVQ